MAIYTASYRAVALKATAGAVKNAPGVLYGWNIWNLDSSVSYLQFYDALAANVVVGTTTPIWSFAIPATGGVDDWVDPASEKGFYVFQTGIAVAATTTVSGSTDPTNGCVVNLGVL